MNKVILESQEYRAVWDRNFRRVLLERKTKDATGTAKWDHVGEVSEDKCLYVLLTEGKMV